MPLQTQLCRCAAADCAAADSYTAGRLWAEADSYAAADSEPGDDRPWRPGRQSAQRRPAAAGRRGPPALGLQTRPRVSVVWLLSVPAPPPVRQAPVPLTIAS